MRSGSAISATAILTRTGCRRIIWRGSPAELTPTLDLSKIYGHYGRRDRRGKAAYHPVMMVRVLLYSYCVGVMSSRRIERASHDDIAFRYLCADQHPDHDTISDFRRLHLPVLAPMFTQVLQLSGLKPGW